MKVTTSSLYFDPPTLAFVIGAGRLTLRTSLHGMLSNLEFETETSAALGSTSARRDRLRGTEATNMDGVTFSDGQLSCAGKDWNEIPRKLAERYGSKARRVDLSYNELITLKNIELFKECEELILDNNSLGDDTVFPALPNLTILTLNKNRISDTEGFLSQVKQLYPKLNYLSLLGNEACPNELVLKDEDDYTRYRYYVLYHLPRLKFLDSRATTKAEIAEAQRVGKFMKVVTVSQDEMYEGEFPAEDNKPSEFHPLPTQSRDASAHRGTIGTCKYVYYGRHSEGNRFIRNNDL
eukprot:m.187137 g.187137  ORF g.187137 m.187137 type:complete len:294 (+) comp18497_c0_seq2:74-955(+)